MTQLIRCPHCGKPVDMAVAKTAAKKAKAAAQRVAKAKAVSVDEVGWSTRVRNVFENFHKDGDYPPIRTLGDVCKYTEAEWMRTPNFGRTSLAEIKDVLKAHGLRMAAWQEAYVSLEERKEAAEYADPKFL